MHCSHVWPARCPAFRYRRNPRRALNRNVQPVLAIAVRWKTPRPPRLRNRRRRAAQARAVACRTQQNVYFSRKFTLEDHLSYNHYDRAELTLNGLLALNSIFLGNIAIDRVTSDSLSDDLIGRYAITPRISLNLDVPFVGRATDYQQGGAVGSAASLDEHNSTGKGLGDVNLSANYKILTETTYRPDTVLTVGITAPTGRAPYDITWENVATSQYEQFAVPTKQPTGNGVWQATVASSFVKTMDPVIVFGNVGYVHSFAQLP